MAFSSIEYLGMFNTILKIGYVNRFSPWKLDPTASIPNELAEKIRSWDSLESYEKRDLIKHMIINSSYFSCFRLSSCVSFGDGDFDPNKENYNNCELDGFDICAKRAPYLRKLLKFMSSTVTSPIKARVNTNYFYNNKNGNNKPRNSGK